MAIERAAHFYQLHAKNSVKKGDHDIKTLHKETNSSRYNTLMADEK
jgi:hypothetical protein